MSEAKKLFTILQSNGWSDEGDNIMEPSGTIWLNKNCPWTGSSEDFLERMAARLERIKDREKYLEEEYGKSSELAKRDTASLIECLTILHEENGS